LDCLVHEPGTRKLNLASSSARQEWNSKSEARITKAVSTISLDYDWDKEGNPRWPDIWQDELIRNKPGDVRVENVCILIAFKKIPEATALSNTILDY